MVDGLGVTSTAVPQPFHDTAPTRQRLLRRRRDRLQVLDPDGPHDAGQHPGRRHLEVELVGQCAQQLVWIAGMYAVQVEIARHVGPRQAEFARRGGQIRGAARGQQIEAQLCVVRSGRAAVVRGEFQWFLAGREDFQNLCEGELAVGRLSRMVFERRHCRCTAFA
jgi:hypothetical protein